MSTSHPLEHSNTKSDSSALTHPAIATEHLSHKLLLDSHSPQSDKSHKKSTDLVHKKPHDQYLDLDTKHLYKDEKSQSQHIVKHGETLSGISREHLDKHASEKDIYNYVDKLAATNHIKNPDRIFPGQMIIYAKDAHERKQPETTDAKAPNTDVHGTQKSQVPEIPKAGGHQVSGAIPPLVTQRPPTAQNPQIRSKEEPDLLHKFSAVAGAIASGAVDEVIHHPGEVIKNAAIGAGVAVAATLAAPEVVAVAATVSTGIGLYQLVRHSGDWIKAGGVVADPQHHSVPDRKAAEETLHGLGRGITDFGAGLAGGGLGHAGLKAVGQATAAETGAFVNKSIEAHEAGKTTPSVNKSIEAHEAGKTTPSVNKSIEAHEAGKTTLSVNKSIEAHAGGKTALSVRVESPEEHIRILHIGEKQYRLTDSAGWFYGKFPTGGNVSPVKLHVSVSSPEDLANLQRVLIPFLKDDPAASKLAHAWKTFDPNHSVSPTSPGAFLPGPTGQNAKGFTIYTNTAKDALELHGRIDKELTAKGLGLERPQDTGNVDIVTGSSNRVGTLRDHYRVTQDHSHNVGIKVDHGLVERIKAHYGSDNNLDTEQLRALEKESGIAPNSLTYDQSNELMLKLSKHQQRPKNGEIYVDESNANKNIGQKNDRPAIYALARLFDWNPADGIIE